MRKLLLLIFIIMMLSLTAVSASDNITDVISDEDDGILTLETPLDEETLAEKATEPPVQETVQDNPVSANDSSEGPVKETSKITTSNVKGYESFTSTLKIQLTSNNTSLTSKPIKIVLDGVTYNKKTDGNGEVNLNFKLKTGTYNAQITYDGDNQTAPATATAKITIKDAIKTKITQGDKDINYRQGSKCLFYVKLVNSKGKAIKNQYVTIKVNGKTYKVKTNKNGNAKLFLNLKKGTYKVKYSFKKTSPYLSSSGSCKIKVKSKMGKGNGYWLWSSHMKSVSLKKLSKKGTKQIFLHVHAIAQYGKGSVVSFIKKAHKYGMKVHLWMQVCYSNGKWVRPINENNKIKYGFLNGKIKEAKRYAKIKGVDGIHFDYVRFGGTAHLYKDPNRAINYFMKKASTQIHKIRSNCIVSAALMPEPKMMTYYYGQDVSTISKYADVLLPMVYKGNYHQTTKWITSVTKTFTKQSNGAQVWTGLQSYHSDNNAKKLTQSSLLKDAKAAKKGGAYGVILFRIGISCNFNFLKAKF